MSDDRTTILVVDDEPDLRELHKIYFEAADFNVLTAENGKDALEILGRDEISVDVVVSDIIMPEMNGYLLCREIKDDPELSRIVVVFVSSLTTLEEKAKGYSYGADDYFSKPLQPEELRFKINNLIEYQNKNASLQSEIKQSQSATMQIMNFYSDLGQVLEFYKSSINAKNYKELCSLVFETLSAFGLRSSMQIVTSDGLFNFGDEGEVSPLESNVIELSRAKSRFFEYGVRLIINYEHFSLLIKNMPVDDADRVGTLRDSLGVLCNAIEARLDSLLDQAINYKKTQITEDVKNVLDQTQKAFNKIEQDTVSAIESLTDDIEDSFLSLGLTDAQEEHIREISKACLNRTNDAFELSRDLYTMFEEINASLNAMQSLNKN